MTEAEWLACKEPDRMLAFFGSKAGDRKLRLLSCAWARLVWDTLIDSRSRRAVEVAELVADSEASESQRAGAEAGARAVTKATAREGASYINFAAIAAAMTAIRKPNPERMYVRVLAGTTRGFTVQVGTAHCTRDIFGSPFNSLRFPREWRTSTAVTLAAQMYESREFGAMPILADALQDAGCDNADVLDHCRGEGPHVRGCWVVDLVLGKA